LSKAYDAIAAKLLAMTDDAGDWRPCWHHTALTMPVNRVTGAAYRGANVLSLWVEAEIHGYQCNQWASFKQWLELGQCVKKGEKGTPIVYFGQHTKENSEGERTRYRFARGAWVFNIAQVAPLEGMPVLGMPAANPDNPLEDARVFAERTGARIYHGPEIDPPHFDPSLDRVAMPPFASFHSAEGYYSVLMHELTHWTGAPKRLHRDSLINYARNRALEELVAELGAAFLCADLGVSNEPRADHAAYLKSWHSTLKNEPEAFMKAVSAASAAAQYLHQLQGEQRAAA
jgi:antirestriction protein ArdC